MSKLVEGLSLRLARPQELEALEELQRRASLELSEYREQLLANPDAIHLPGVYVKRLVLGAPYDKKIEFRTVRSRETA